MMVHRKICYYAKRKIIVNLKYHTSQQGHTIAYDTVTIQHKEPYQYYLMISAPQKFMIHRLCNHLPQRRGQPQRWTSGPFG